jgi:hypothetical protein
MLYLVDLRLRSLYAASQTLYHKKRAEPKAKRAKKAANPVKCVIRHFVGSGSRSPAQMILSAADAAGSLKKRYAG